ncbi:RING finger protein 151-like [Grus japonensis]|uniref:RING finger protein 151-like n=6 Tax=Neoaves TaxID=3078114 RepID=A0ABC9WAE2_GRUJA
MIDVSLLRPLYRYMKNDLNRLQLHCKNRDYGCEMVCSLESIDRHERECEYSQIPCSNAGCTVQIERRNLDGHLAVCEYRSRECPNGCGYTILSAEDTQHNCVAELRTELELLRSEMICRVEEAKHEMESRLDSQRRHMVQKESILQNEIEELKSQMSRMMSDVRSLMAAERQHRQELEQAELEKRELMELLRGLQKDCRLTTTEGSRKSTNFRPLARLESVKRKPREVTVI